jgi:hypothetical protein
MFFTIKHSLTNAPPSTSQSASPPMINLHPPPSRTRSSERRTRTKAVAQVAAVSAFVMWSGISLGIPSDCIYFPGRRFLSSAPHYGLLSVIEGWSWGNEGEG